MRRQLVSFIFSGKSTAPRRKPGDGSAVRRSGDMNAKVILNSEEKEREDMVVSDTTLARINELAKKPRLLV